MRREREGKKERLKSRAQLYLEDMPMNDWPPRILNHFLPVLQFGAFAIITERNFANGIGCSDSVIITYRQFKGHALL